MCLSAAHADDLLFEDFEDNTTNFLSSNGLFHDGNADYFHIVPLNGVANSVDPYTLFNGSNYFAAEDIDDGGTRPGTQTLAFNLNVAGVTDMTVGMLFAAGGNGAGTPAYDSNDGFLVRAQLDGGAFQNLLAFEAIGTTNQVLRRDTDFDGTGDGFQPTSEFALYDNLAIAGTGTNLLVEVVFSSNDGNVEFAIDDVTISGTVAVPEPSALGLVGMFGIGLILRRRRRS